MFDGRHRLLAARAIDGHEPAYLEGLAKQRQLREFLLEQDMQTGMERSKQNGRIDVALMVAAEDHGFAWPQMLTSCYARTDAGERGPDGDTPVAEHIQQALPAERQRERHTDGRRDRDIHGHGDIRSDGPNPCDERGHTGESTENCWEV